MGDFVRIIPIYFRRARLGNRPIESLTEKNNHR